MDNKNKEKKEGFFRRAFRQMRENAKAQHEVDKANLEAVKAESKAKFEENRGTNTLKRAKENASASWAYAKMSADEKIAMERQKQAIEIAEANARKKDAEERIIEARNERAQIKKERQERKSKK